MSFTRGMKIRLDSDVELLGAAFKPTAAACTEWSRFFNFAHTEK